MSTLSPFSNSCGSTSMATPPLHHYGHTFPSTTGTPSSPPSLLASYSTVLLTGLPTSVLAKSQVDPLGK